MLHTLTLHHVPTGYWSHVSSLVQTIVCTVAFCMKGHAAWSLFSYMHSNRAMRDNCMFAIIHFTFFVTMLQYKSSIDDNSDCVTFAACLGLVIIIIIIIKLYFQATTHR